MSDSVHLPIYIESYRLTQDIFQYSLKFPKEFKFLLGQAMNETALELCCLISQANRQPDKSVAFDPFFMQLERLRLQIRLCSDFKLLTPRQQAVLATHMERINTQASAWVSSERRKVKS